MVYLERDPTMHGRCVPTKLFFVNPSLLDDRVTVTCTLRIAGARLTNHLHKGYIKEMQTARHEEP